MDFQALQHDFHLNLNQKFWSSRSNFNDWTSIFREDIADKFLGFTLKFRIEGLRCIRILKISKFWSAVATLWTRLIVRISITGAAWCADSLKSRRSESIKSRREILERTNLRHRCLRLIKINDYSNGGDLKTERSMQNARERSQSARSANRIKDSSPCRRRVCFN